MPIYLRLVYTNPGEDRRTSVMQEIYMGIDARPAADQPACRHLFTGRHHGTGHNQDSRAARPRTFGAIESGGSWR